MKRNLAAGIVLAALSSATVLVSAAAAPSHALPSERAGAFQVTASVNKTEPLLDSKVKIKATVSPAAPGAAVTLQVKYQGRSWKTIDHGRLNGAGKVTFKDTVGSVRERRYRVVKPAEANRAAGQGSTSRVTVFGWRSLTSLDPTFNTGFYQTKTLSVNGTAYPDSLLTGTAPAPPWHIDYNLNRDCKLLEARYGVADSSTSNGTASLSLVADSVQRYAGSFALTQSEAVTTDITDVFRITLNAATANGGIAAVATPRVLCSF